MIDMECPKCRGDIEIDFHTPLEIKCPHCGVDLWCYWDEDAGGDAWRGLEMNEWLSR